LHATKKVFWFFFSKKNYFLLIYFNVSTILSIKPVNLLGT
jgi:hypothetical protein